MSEVWVVNASPVITLAKIGRLDLLGDAGDVVVPGPVAGEILAGPVSDPARRALEQGWGWRVEVDHVPVAVLEWGLGAGESSVLAWAISRPPSIAILDDGKARMCARTLGVPLLGTLGVVLRARREGKIPLVAPVLRKLQGAGLRLDERVIRAALKRIAGEEWDE